MTSKKKTASPRHRAPSARTKASRMRVGIKRAFAMVRDMAEHPDRYPENTILLAPEDAGSVFTPERARIYSLVRERAVVPSVNELAELLGRDVTRVSRDVAFLEGYGLLHTERAPGQKTKQIHADLRPVVIA